MLGGSTGRLPSGLLRGWCGGFIVRGTTPLALFAVFLALFSSFGLLAVLLTVLLAALGTLAFLLTFPTLSTFARLGVVGLGIVGLGIVRLATLSTLAGLC